jgi:aryl-alcohol dehydrogenase-like predicted oxidoreductase
MEYTRLGRTGLLVSRLLLGTMNFGPDTNEADSFAIMDRAHEHGINFFDTANNYGWVLGEGVTEQILGRWFAQGGGRREKTVLATKLFNPMGEWPNQSRVSALHIRQACEESLRRLQTDHIDVYQLHHIDRDAPWDEIWEAMDVLRYQGKVLYVGASNFAGWHIAQAQESAQRHGVLGLVSEQSRYNLLRRTIELEVIPAAQEYGLGIIAWSPLDQGLLTGLLRKQNEGSRRYNESATAELERQRDKVEAYEALCDEIGQDPSTVALSWIMSRPGITGPIIGPRSVAQLDHALKSIDYKPDADVLARLDEIFPGHKTAPEDYAW